MASYAIKTYHGSYNIKTRTTAPKVIVIHYTGAGSPNSGAAKANCIYFSGANRNASAHYFIDNGNIYEYADPKTHYAWHVGDGKGAYRVDGITITNANSIGIEVCQSGDKPFTTNEIARLEWLVQKLMRDFDIPASRVIMHWHASRKVCPYYYASTPVRRSTEWKELHAKITGTKFPYLVKIITDELNVRKGPNTSYGVVTVVKRHGVYTIIDEKNGWGKLKSGAGWINLNYTTRI